MFAAGRVWKRCVRDGQKRCGCSPTTFFVDSEGIVLREPILGANTKEYEEKVEGLLQ